MAPYELATPKGAPPAKGGKFEVGQSVILLNGTLCYEAEVLQFAATDPTAATTAKTGAAKKGAAEAGGSSYLIRYLKWARSNHVDELSLGHAH